MTPSKRTIPRRISTSVQQKRRSSDTKPPRRGFTALEQERCDVLSRHVAQVAADNRAVRNARELLFGGPTQVVSLHRAQQLIASPATKYLDPAWFKEKGIPFALHEAEAGGQVNIPGPGLQLDRRVRVRVEWPGGKQSIDTEVRVTARDGGSLTSQLAYRDGALSLIVFQNTWLELLKFRCALLSTTFLWTEQESLTFLMCGIAPELVPVRADWKVARDNLGQPLRTEVILRLQPFVSIHSVDRVLVTMRMLLGRRLRPGPPMGHRTLANFEFVEERRAQAEWTTPPWSELVRAWDQAHARDGLGYGGDRRNFRRDFERGRRQLLADYLPTRERLDVRPSAARATRVSPKRRR